MSWHLRRFYATFPLYTNWSSKKNLYPNHLSWAQTTRSLNLETTFTRRKKLKKNIEMGAIFNEEKNEPPQGTTNLKKVTWLTSESAINQSASRLQEQAQFPSRPTCSRRGLILNDSGIRFVTLIPPFFTCEQHSIFRLFKSSNFYLHAP